MKKLVIPFLSVVLLWACKDNQELDFMQMYQQVVLSEGEWIEWHGEPQNVEAKDSLSIFEEGQCSSPSCGKALFLKNTSNRKISVLLQAPFQIEDFSNHLATRYQIEPQAQLPIGCTHFCFKDKQYLFERKIVGAEFVD